MGELRIPPRCAPRDVRGGCSRRCRRADSRKATHQAVLGDRGGSRRCRSSTCSEQGRHRVDVSEGGLCRGLCGFQPTTTHDFPHPEARGRRQAVGRRSRRTPLVIGRVPRATGAIRVGVAAITVTMLRVAVFRAVHAPAAAGSWRTLPYSQGWRSSDGARRAWPGSLRIGTRADGAGSSSGEPCYCPRVAGRDAPCATEAYVARRDATVWPLAARRRSERGWSMRTRPRLLSMSRAAR